jgi:hypothetical protein
MDNAPERQSAASESRLTETKQLNIRLPVRVYRSLSYIADLKGESLPKLIERELVALLQREAAQARDEALRRAEEAQRDAEMLVRIATLDQRVEKYDELEGQA